MAPFFFGLDLRYFVSLSFWKVFFYPYLNLQTTWAPCHLKSVGDTDGTTNWLNEMGLDVATMMRLGVCFFRRHRSCGEGLGKTIAVMKAGDPW